MSAWDSHDFDRLLIAAGKKEKEKGYWLERLSGELTRSSFPSIKSQRSTPNAIDTVHSRFDNHLYSGLMKLSAGSDVRLHIILTTLLTLLLSKYSGNHDIILGTPLLTADDAIDDLINTVLIVRNQFHDAMTFKELLLQVRQTIIEADAHRNYPIELLIRQLNVPAWNEGDAFSLLDTTIVLENIQNKGYISRVNPKVSFLFFKGDGFIDGNVEYNASFYDRPGIERVLTHFRHLAEIITDHPDIQLSEIEIITEEEKKQILNDFNDTEAAYPKDKTIHQLFEAQVEKTPDYVALIGPTSVGALREAPLEKDYGAIRESPLQKNVPLQLSYRELDNQSNRLANELIEKGVHPDTIVGIKIERSIEMIVGILGILKAGGAYLPIDPNYPQDRMDYILKDSAARWFLTERTEDTGVVEVETLRSSEGKKVLFIEPLILSTSQPLNLFPSSPSVSSVRNQSSLAYVIYTSGSTGKPKGVMIEHRAFHNFMEAMTTIIDFRPGKNILALTTITFDIFGLETVLPLCRGLKVVLADETHQKEMTLLATLLIREGVDMLQATPSRMQMFTIISAHSPCLKNLKEIMIGGEALPAKLLDDLKRLTHAKIYNMYGPTETTVWSSVAALTPTSEITIGKPIANTQLVILYILNQHANIQPVGVAGELHIGGDGLARGYLNRPELTFERFCCLRRPAFCKKRGKNFCFEKLGNDKFYNDRFYKTGDLCRWSEDGNVEFLGRIDFQVKIRGYRIELGELENALMRFESIKDAAVTVHEDARGEPHLVAYLVPHSTKDKETIDEVREFLHTQLPAYMIPSFFVLLENLPLTPNGKLDRKALPNPEFPRGTYVAPTNDIEEKIVGIWKDILKLDPIGVHDSFFKIGGTSLNIIQVNTRLKEVFNLDIPMPAMFEYPTIRTLSQYIKTLSPGGNSRNSPREDVKPMNKPAPTGKNKLKDRKKIMTGESHV